MCVEGVSLWAPLVPPCGWSAFMPDNPQPYRWSRFLMAVEDVASEKGEMAIKAHSHLCTTSGIRLPRLADFSPVPGPGDTSTHHQQLQVCSICWVLNEAGGGRRHVTQEPWLRCAEALAQVC